MAVLSNFSRHFRGEKNVGNSLESSTFLLLTARWPFERHLEIQAISQNFKVVDSYGRWQDRKGFDLHDFLGIFSIYPKREIVLAGDDITTVMKSHLKSRSLKFQAGIHWRGPTEGYPANCLTNPSCHVGLA
jgi:hypothetical protein